MRINWTGFTSNDWMGFAGAELFADGSSPLIAEIKVNGAPGVAVYDAHGIEVYWYPDDGEVECTEALWGAAVGRAAAMLPSETTTDGLRSFGFRRINRG